MERRAVFGALLLLSLSSPAAGGDIMMTFEGQPVIPPGVYAPPYELKAGDTHTYYFNTTFEDSSAEAQFDYDVILEVLSGDADLLVSGPITDASGTTLTTPTLKKVSLHHTGDEVVFITRGEILVAGQGLYSATVHGYGKDNAYRMVLEEAYTSRFPPAEEQAALEAIYQKCCTEDEEACSVLAKAVESSGETDPENFCHLPEQSCNSEGHITSLRLPGQDLQCDFPDELGVLTHLKRLDLQDNLMTGTVDELFTAFVDVAVESIQLQRNEFAGSLSCLPTEGNLSQTLSYLDLSYNRLEGEVPKCIFGPEIMILTLEGNYMSGELPPELPPSENMQHLDISWQEEDEAKRMTGPLPNFTVWPNLQYLSIEDNRFTGPFPSVPQGLQSLHVANNELEGPLPDLADMQELVSLFASGNKFDGPLPSELPSSLMIFDLGDNDLTGQVPAEAWLSSAPALKEIRVGGNQLVGEFPVQFGQFPWLWALNTTGNSFEGTFDAFVAALPHGNSIVQFEASSNKMTGALPPSMSKLAMLKDSFDPPAPRELYQRHRFKVAFNNLSGAFPTALVLDASNDIYLDFDARGNSFECPSTWLGMEFENPMDFDVLLQTDCLDAEGGATTLVLNQQSLIPITSGDEVSASFLPPKAPKASEIVDREDGGRIEAETEVEGAENGTTTGRAGRAGSPVSADAPGSSDLGLDKVYASPDTESQDLLVGSQNTEAEAQVAPEEPQIRELSLKTIIIIASAGAVAALLCVACAVTMFCCCRKRRAKAYQRYGTGEGMTTPRKGTGPVVDSKASPDLENAGSSSDHSMELSRTERMSGADKAQLGDELTTSF